MLSSSAAWPSANCPVATSALARASSSSTRNSAGAVPGSSRSASPNHAAALAGARWAAASPASRRVATAAASPWRAERSTWCARSVAGAPRDGERLGAPLVSAQSPAAGRRLVDGPSNERVPEAKAAGHLGLTNEVELQQLVQRLERRSLGHRRGGRRKLGLERVARHRSRPPARAVRRPTAKRAPRRARQQPPAARRDPSGDSSGPPCAAFTSERSGELLQIERVAAALLVESGRRGRGRLPRRGARRPRRASARRRRRPTRVPARCARSSAAVTPLRRLTGTDSQRDEHRRGRWPAQQRPEQLDGCGVGPVEVVEDQHERRGRRESLEQLAHGAVSAIALVLEDSRRRAPRT